jgi:hypothetical protein
MKFNQKQNRKILNLNSTPQEGWRNSERFLKGWFLEKAEWQIKAELRK